MRIFWILFLLLGIYSFDYYKKEIYFVQYFPIENRDQQYQKWLSASVKISVNGTYGSGTIIYYDSYKNLAYIATCGHLWNGTMTAAEGVNKKITCQITSWWQPQKLDKPKTYEARVIFYNNVAGSDTALLTFKPDWKPDYFPIANLNYKYKENQYLNSLGCDKGSEVAHYKVKIVGIQKNNLITIENSPRPGRSGGGLMSEQYYVGTCWGTSSVDGTGYGYFTLLKAIHSVWERNGYGFLLNIKREYFAQKIKIIDKNSLQKVYSKEYILIPYVKE